MEKKLQEFLRPGEQVCWQGQPGPFGLMEGSCKKQILCKWGVAVVIIGLLLWSYITFNTNPSVGFVAMVLLVGVIILASPPGGAAEPAGGPLLDHGPAGHHDDQG